MVWPFSPSDTKSTQPEEVKQISPDVQNSAKTRLSGIPEYPKETRRRKLVDAVNENCALEAAALLECQDSWFLWNRMTLCHAFQSKYMDCLNTQRSLLTQMGYGKEGNTETEDEFIKWHADELYQKRTRDQEREKSQTKTSQEKSKD